jgi:hypothetical membrane protein
MTRIAAIILLLTGIALPTAIGLIQPDYSASASYLSELGADGAAYNQLVTYGAFLPVALASAFILAIRLAAPGEAITARIGLGLLFAIPIGYLGAVVFPCLPGCPVPGTGRQALHNTAGIIEYLGGMAGFAMLASIALRRGTRLMRWVTPPATLAFIVGIVLAADPAWAGYKGAFQRLADYSAFIWIAIAGWTGPIAPTAPRYPAGETPPD